MSDSGSQKIALVTGITGQDGSYLTELLLEKGYIVSDFPVVASAGFICVSNAQVPTSEYGCVMEAVGNRRSG